MQNPHDSTKNHGDLIDLLHVGDGQEVLELELKKSAREPILFGQALESTAHATVLIIQILVRIGRSSANRRELSESLPRALLLSVTAKSRLLVRGLDGTELVAVRSSVR